MLILAFALLAAGASDARDPLQLRDTTTERVTGVVQDTLGKPIPSATVIITRGPDRFVATTTTDSAGSFSVEFRPGTGDYLIHVSSPALGAVRRRVQRGDRGIAVPVVLVLRGNAQTLRRVVVEATRPRPPRGQSTEADPGNASTALEGLGGWLATARPGSVTEQLTSVPGVLSTDGSLTVAGLATQAHQTTLNGSEVDVGALPSLATTRLRVATSTVDPSQGGFSGAQVAIEMTPGSNIAHRKYSVSVVPPAPFTDRPVNAYFNRRAQEELSLNAAAAGALIYDRLYYSMAGQATLGQQRLSLDPREALGTQPISRLDDALGTLGLPLRVTPSDDRTFALSGVARIDRTPRGTHAVQATMFGRMSRASSYGDAPSTNERTLEVDSWSGAVQASHAAYVGSTLNELRGAVTVSTTSTHPRLGLPEGRVLLDATVDAGSGGSLLFGGTGSGRSTRQRLSAELVNETSRFLHGTAHRVKSAAGVRIVGESRHAETNAFGTFQYRDLAALEGNRPSSFTIATPQDGSVSLGSAFLALSDNWRLAPTARVLYGVRLDVRESPSFPVTANAEEDRRRTKYATDLSPRVGLTWAYRTPSRTEPPVRSGAMGTFSTRPHGVVRGSAGRYTGPKNIDALIQAESYARGAQRRMRCLGAAAPTPDWMGMLDGSAPELPSCAGTGALVDSSMAEYHTAGPLAGEDSWRISLGWSGAVHALSIGVDATWSWTRRIMTLTPDGLPLTTQFLSAPDQRPVFVPPDAIDPGSGLFIPTIGAATQGLAYSFSERGRGRAAQITLSVSPLSANVSRRHWSFAYTLASSRIAALGLDYPGGVGPARGEMVPAPFDIRHTLIGQAGVVTGTGYSFVALSRLQSGTPFTPIIAGDVDGDGVAGDRAFVPASTAGGSIGASVQSAAASTTSAGRSCLQQSAGAIAGINSCRAPWTLNTTLLLRTPAGIDRHLPLGERVTATVYADNVVSLVDRLVNGSRLHGWGSNAGLDPVLLRVAGFDAATRSFIYQPNLGFARTRSASAPYRIGFTVSVDVSQPGTAQSLRRFLSPGRGRNPGPRMSADTIAARFGETVLDVYDMVLEQSDSLLLRRDQADSLAAWQPEYRRTVSALWSTLGKELAALDDRYDAAAVLARTDSVTDSAWAIAQLHAHRIFQVLDPVQQTLVPGLLRMLATSNQPVRVRVTTPW